MLHIIENQTQTAAFPFGNAARSIDDFAAPASTVAVEDYAADDIDLVDDALLNTSPHNFIERQLLTGDMVGLALMSGAILWSAMGAFG